MSGDQVDNGNQTKDGGIKLLRGRADRDFDAFLPIGHDDADDDDGWTRA